MKKSMFMLLALAALVTPVYAQGQAPSCPDNKLVIGSGTAGGTYGPMMKQLAPKCSMICDATNTEGGLDNLEKVVRKEFDGGIVQADTIELLGKQLPDVKNNVRSLFPLHGSSLHIISMKAGFPVTTTRTVKPSGLTGYFRSDTVENVVENAAINTLMDLQGKPVAAWSSAFGSMLIINQRQRLNMDVVEAKDRNAGFAMLKSGKVAAFVGAGGTPLAWVDGPKPDVSPDTMQLVDVSPDLIEQLGAPYYNRKTFYRNLGGAKNLISVRNEMVVYDLQGGERAQAVTEFRQCFLDNVQALRNARGSHPAWADVDPNAKLFWIPYQSSASPGIGGTQQQMEMPRSRR